MCSIFYKLSFHCKISMKNLKSLQSLTTSPLSNLAGWLTSVLLCVQSWCSPQSAHLDPPDEEKFYQDPAHSDLLGTEQGERPPSAVQPLMVGVVWTEIGGGLSCTKSIKRILCQ